MKQILKAPKAVKRIIYENSFMEPFVELIGTMDGNSLVILISKIYEYVLGLNLSDDEKLETVKNIVYVQKNGYNFNKVVRQIQKNIEYNNAISLKFGLELEYTPQEKQFLYYRWCISGARKFEQITQRAWNEDILKGDPKRTFERIEEAISNFEKSQKDFGIAVAKYADFEDSFVSDKTKFFAIVPKTHKELYQEGIDMKNCLVMRGPYVASGEMKVVFLRKEEDKPYIDIILNAENKIIWAIRESHVTVEGEDLEAVFLWYKRNISNKVSTPDNIWV